jgi:hypothetical protein
VGKNGYRKDSVDPKVNYRDKELPFHHPVRMGRDAAQCMNDTDMWLTIGFTLAMHVKHMLLVLEEHGLTYLLEENTSVGHLFKDEIHGKSRNGESIRRERELIY